MLNRKIEGWGGSGGGEVKSHVRETIMCLDVKNNATVLVQLLWDQDRKSSREK